MGSAEGAAPGDSSAQEGAPGGSRKAASVAVNDAASRRTERIALSLAALWALAWMWHYVNVTFDDAFISFRYAENLAAGDGLVFNPGERVEGFSNFLWTVGLVPLVWLGVPSFEFGMLVSGKLLGAVAGVGTLLTTLALARRVGGARFAWVAPLVLALQAPLQFWSVGALETLLAGLLECLAVCAHLDEVHGVRAGTRASDGAGAQGLRAPSSLFWLLASLTRPEPPLYFAVCLLDRAWSRLCPRWREVGARVVLAEEARFLAWFVVPFAAFLTFRLGYYGELLPNTYYAKVGGARIWEKGLSYVTVQTGRLGWGFVLPLLVLGLGLGRRFDARVRLIAALLGAHLFVVVREGGDWMPAARFLVPTLPLVAVLGHAALLGFVEFGFMRWLPRGELPSWVIAPSWVEQARRFSRGVVARRMERVTQRLGALLVVVVMVTAGLGSSRTVNIAWFPSGYGGPWFDCFEHFELARYIHRKLPRPALLAAGEAGVLPYYTRLRFLDLGALMDKHLARQPGGMHRKYDVDYVLGRAPDYVVLQGKYSAATRKLDSTTEYSLRLMADGRFLERYRFEWQHQGLVLFVRRTLPGAGD